MGQVAQLLTHVDDIGVYIKLNNPPTNGTLEFWPYGTVGQWDFFNTVDFYHLILVRNAAGVITIYVNGHEFATYDDSGTQKFVPGPPDNFIVFFRDHPSVLANEASPGFVSYIILTAQIWSADEVQDVWENFCPSLIGVTNNEDHDFMIYPNPVTDNRIYIKPGKNQGHAPYSIYDAKGNLILQGKLPSGSDEIDLSGLVAGLYLIKMQYDKEVVCERIIKQ